MLKRPDQLVEDFLSRSTTFSEQTLPIHLGILTDEWYFQFGTEMPDTVREDIHSKLNIAS